MAPAAPLPPLDRCPVCELPLDGDRPDTDVLSSLARHLVEEAGRSDGAHVMWLNRNVTKRRVDASELARLLRSWSAGAATDEDRVRR